MKKKKIKQLSLREQKEIKGKGGDIIIVDIIGGRTEKPHVGTIIIDDIIMG